MGRYFITLKGRAGEPSFVIVPKHRASLLGDRVEVQRGAYVEVWKVCGTVNEKEHVIAFHGQLVERIKTDLQQEGEP